MQAAHFTRQALQMKPLRLRKLANGVLECEQVDWLRQMGCESRLTTPLDICRHPISAERDSAEPILAGCNGPSSASIVCRALAPRQQEKRYGAHQSARHSGFPMMAHARNGSEVVRLAIDWVTRENG